MKRERLAQPITQEMYEGWRNNPCTQQLMFDLQFAALEESAEVSMSRGPDTVKDQALTLAALNDVTAIVVGWYPEGVDAPSEVAQ